MTAYNEIPETRLQMLNRILDGNNSIPHNLTIREWKYLENNGFCKFCRKKCKIDHDKGF